MLDGTEITETTRQFLRSWQANKDAVKQRLESNSGINGQQPSTGGRTRGQVLERTARNPIICYCCCFCGSVSFFNALTLLVWSVDL